MRNKPSGDDMLFSRLILTAAFLAVGALGYQVGVAQSHTPTIQTINLERVQVTQIHPAALYVRQPDGHEYRYLIEDRNRDWANTLLQNPGRRWHMELTNSPDCPGRYTLTTLLSQPK